MSSVGPVAGRKRGIFAAPTCPKRSFFFAGTYTVVPSPGPPDAGVKSCVRRNAPSRASENVAKLAPRWAGTRPRGCKTTAEGLPGAETPSLGLAGCS